MAFDTDLVGTYGYCCDISRSWIVGDARPNAEQRALYQVAYEHVMTNIGLIEAGMSFTEMTRVAHCLPGEYRRCAMVSWRMALDFVMNIPACAIPRMSRHMAIVAVLSPE